MPRMRTVSAERVKSREVLDEKLYEHCGREYRVVLVREEFSDDEYGEMEALYPEVYDEKGNRLDTIPYIPPNWDPYSDRDVFAFRLPHEKEKALLITVDGAYEAIVGVDVVEVEELLRNRFWWQGCAE